MSLNPIISVIVPNYNHAEFLKQRLDSVFNQTFSSFEVIVLDDCSIDDSMRVIDAYREKKELMEVIKNDLNGGSSVKQWQKGFKKAKGEWIWIAESDDFSDLGFLESMMNFSFKNPECGVLYCQTVDVDVNGNRIQSRLEYTKIFNPNKWENSFKASSDEFLTQFMKVKNVIPNASAVIFKKELIDFENDFDSEFLSMRYTGDWLFWSRLIRKTKIGFNAVELNFFREHQATTRVHNSSQKIYQRLSEEIKIRNIFQDWFPELDQKEEWEIIYSKWFQVQSSFPFLNPKFYFARKSDLSIRGYILKFRQYKNKRQQ